MALTRAEKQLAANVTPAVEVTAMYAGPPFRVGKFYLLRDTPCEECNGTGKWNDYDGTTVLDCDTCGGTGKVLDPDARLAGPFDTAREAVESREVVGVRNSIVTREGEPEPPSDERRAMGDD